MILLIIVFLAAVGGLCYYILNTKKEDSGNPAPAPVETVDNEPEEPGVSGHNQEQQ